VNPTIFLNKPAARFGFTVKQLQLTRRLISGK
jgi:hypothetical protein